MADASNSNRPVLKRAGAYVDEVVDLFRRQRELEARLIDLLGQLLALQDRRRAGAREQGGEGLHVMSAADLREEVIRLHRGEPERIASGPEGEDQALRAEIRKVGEDLFAELAMDGMREGFEAATKAHGGRGVSALDHIWSGVGHWLA